MDPNTLATTIAQAVASALAQSTPPTGDPVKSAAATSVYGTVSSSGAGASGWTLCHAAHPDAVTVTRDGETVTFPAGSPCERALKSPGRAAEHGVESGHVPMYIAQ